MTKYSIVLVCFIITLFLTCSNKRICKYQVPEKILSVPLESNGEKSYQHLVLMNGLQKNCLDSSAILNLLHTYINQARDSESPIASIEIFNSKEGYDAGETLSQPEEFYRNCLVTIWFDIATGKPYNLYFYSSDREVIYEGPLWWAKN